MEVHFSYQLPLQCTNVKVSFTPRPISPDIHWTGGWFDPKSAWTLFGKEISALAPI
jgi:hypothetical protein